MAAVAAKIDFKDGGRSGHLEFLIGSILTNFDLLVVSILPTKFRVKWSFGSEDEVLNRILRWRSILD